jgi:hypothetical protein
MEQMLLGVERIPMLLAVDFGALADLLDLKASAREFAIDDAVGAYAETLLRRVRTFDVLNVSVAAAKTIESFEDTHRVNLIDSAELGACCGYKDEPFGHR